MSTATKSRRLFTRTSRQSYHYLAVSFVTFQCVVVSPSIIPIKLSYCGNILFSPAVPQYLSLFLMATNISLISPRRKRRYNSPNTMGTIPTVTFQSYFLLHSLRSTFYMVIGGDILGYCYDIFPNKSIK